MILFNRVLVAVFVGFDCIAFQGWVKAVEPGELVITEFMADTSHSDGDLEWFEVFSRATERVHLGGWAVADDGSIRGGIADGARIDPGGFVVLTPDPERFLGDWPGVAADHVFGWTGSFALANSEDEIYLMDPLDRTIASVRYTDGDPGDADISVYRKYSEGALDGSDIADWREKNGSSLWSSSDATVSGAGSGNVDDPLAFLSSMGALASPGMGAYAEPIPEPGLLSLLFLGCGACGLRRLVRGHTRC